MLDDGHADCTIVGHLFLQCSRENRTRPWSRRYRLCHPVQTYFTPDSAPSITRLALPPHIPFPFAFGDFVLAPSHPFPSEDLPGFPRKLCFIFISVLTLPQDACGRSPWVWDLGWEGRMETVTDNSILIVCQVGDLLNLRPPLRHNLAFCDVSGCHVCGGSCHVNVLFPLQRI